MTKPKKKVRPTPNILTQAQARAIRILLKRAPMRPREFADAMWPDSPSHTVYAMCGPKGSHRGGRMYTAGGGYLGKLRKLGLAEGGYWPDGYYASDLAFRLLDAGKVKDS